MSKLLVCSFPVTATTIVASNPPIEIINFLSLMSPSFRIPRLPGDA